MHTALVAQTQEREFNWVDVTEEVYSVTSCDEFPNGTAMFANMSLAWPDGAALAPDWTLTPPLPTCNGSIEQTASHELRVTHRLA